MNNNVTYSIVNLAKTKHFCTCFQWMLFVLFISDAELQQLQNTPANIGGQRPRKAPICKKCGQPRKGHKKGQCSSTGS